MGATTGAGADCGSRAAGARTSATAGAAAATGACMGAAAGAGTGAGACDRRGRGRGCAHFYRRAIYRRAVRQIVGCNARCSGAGDRSRNCRRLGCNHCSGFRAAAIDLTSARAVLAARSALTTTLTTLAPLAAIAALAAFATRWPLTASRRTITFRQGHRRCFHCGRLALWCRLGRALFALAIAVARRTLLALGTLALLAAFAAVAAAAGALLGAGLTFRLHWLWSFLARLLFAAFLRFAVIASFSALARLAPLFVAIAPVAARLIAAAAAIPLAARGGLLFRFRRLGLLKQGYKTAPQRRRGRRALRPLASAPAARA